MNVLSLFSGVEGIGQAMHIVNQMLGREVFKIAAMCEIEPYAVQVLKLRYPGVPIYGDVREVTAQRLRNDGIGSIDLLCGGFPCQPFSLAGRREGEFDERHLWPEMYRLIGELRPRWVLGENVDGINSIADVSGRRGGVLGTIFRDLAGLGYRVGKSCYGVSDIGGPHQRRRVFIVGYLADTDSQRWICGGGIWKK